MFQKLLVALFVCLAAVSAVAQTADVITIVPELKWGDPAPTCFENDAGLTTVTLHLVILQPTGLAVSGWHAGEFTVEGGTLLDAELIDGFDLTPDNELSVLIDNEHDVLQSNDSGVIHLATLEVLLPAPDAEAMVRLTPSPLGGYTYDGFARLYQAWPVAPHGQEDGVVAYRIAPDCEQYVANETMDWSVLKRRYR